MSNEQRDAAKERLVARRRARSRLAPQPDGLGYRVCSEPVGRAHDVRHARSSERWRYSCDERGIEVVEKLLAAGMNPNDKANGGCSAIQNALTQMDWEERFRDHIWSFDSALLDTERTRNYLRVIHLLARHGGRWAPDDAREINAARRALLKMKPDYLLEFVWILAKYAASSKADVEVLLRTPKVKRHVAKHASRLAQLLRDWQCKHASV